MREENKDRERNNFLFLRKDRHHFDAKTGNYFSPDPNHLATHYQALEQRLQGPSSIDFGIPKHHMFLFS